MLPVQEQLAISRTSYNLKILGECQSLPQRDKSQAQPVACTMIHQTEVSGCMKAVRPV